MLTIFLVQLSTSSLRIHGGAIFSAVSGRKSIPISAIEAPEHGAWYRLHGFCLTITFLFNSSTPGRFPLKLPCFVEGFACFIRMDLLQMANTCGLQDGKSFNFNGNFNWKRPGVLDLNKK